MKFFLSVVIILVIAVFVAIVTKPSDEQCITLMKGKLNKELYNSTAGTVEKTVGSVLVDFGLDKAFFRIEDKVLYKEVYLKFGNRKLGTAAFGSFFASDLPKEIKL